MSTRRTTPASRTLVATLDRAAKAWVDDFATEAIRIGGGPGSYRPALYELGVRRFDAIKDVNREITAELQAEVVDARAAAQDTLNATFSLLAGIGLLAAAGMQRARLVGAALHSTTVVRSSKKSLIGWLRVSAMPAPRSPGRRRSGGWGWR